MPGTSGLSAHPAGDRLSEIQHEVLEATASGQGLVPAMDLLCRRVEALAPGVVCSILSVDQQGLLHPLMRDCGVPRRAGRGHRYRNRPAVGRLQIAAAAARTSCLLVEPDQGARQSRHRHFRVLLPGDTRPDRVRRAHGRNLRPSLRDRARARGSKNEDPSAGVLRFRHWPAQPRYVPAARGQDCHGAPSR
jgi:hypothetical protein